ncbi:DNA repair protein REV1-like [Varroa destructor]|uniref:DNA repair protein REV1 n=1 Tax=Varroa destructor TaxID=109461 RepID=A0A7M7KEY6_VARDE|nr:DNA repair protein REV1-like [Varroa destructor]XP_022662443.1 DNA repair protein REV1-like [Varroa destructor]XP_022662444.1 DNA repair protein REV1-like [Varroa destructor]
MSGSRAESRKEALRRTAQQAWPDGYMTAKIQKLEIQFQADNRQFEKKSDIFQGVSIHVNGYTQPPADELRRLIGVHGGGYMNYFVRGANHFVICCNLSKAKKTDWLRYAVKPEWIVDSIKEGRRLAVADYYLEKKRTVFDYRQAVVQTEMNTCGTISDIVIGKDAEGPRPEMEKKDFVKKEEPRTASDVGFVEKFFAKSRLSFIARMKVKMKEYLRTIMENPSHHFSGRQTLQNEGNLQNETLESVYMHIDMDCFFASVAIRNRPELKQRPVAVCSNQKAKRKNQDPNLDLTDYRSWNWHDASTAEISCCNYAARQFGVHASMYLGQAQALCPDLVILPYDFEGFEEVSRCLYDAVASLTLNIEAQSVDELFADVSDVIEDTHCTPEDIGKYLKSTILEKTACTCTVGMGPNMLIARLATKKAKPDGFCYISQDQVAEFVSDKKVSDIPGVGDSTEIKLRDLGITTCLELQHVPLADLKELIGANQARKLVDLAKGICNRTIKDARTTQQKNISVEINYGMRFKQISEVTNCLNELADEAHKRLQNSNLAAEVLRLRILVRHPDAPEETMKYLGCGMCDQLAKSETFKIPITSRDMIGDSVQSLYAKLNPVIKDIRGLSITLSKLTSVQKVPKISNIEAFLGRSVKPDLPTLRTESANLHPDPSFRQERTANNGSLEIYILSSTEESGGEDCAALLDEPRPRAAVTTKKKPTFSKKRSKLKLICKKGKKAKKRGQLDIRRVIEFGKETRGKLAAVRPRKLLELPAMAHASAIKLDKVKQCERDSSSVREGLVASFGPKKLFHLCRLLHEWLNSSMLPTETDISAWITSLQQVAIEDPRSCTALLRCMFRQARKASSSSNIWTTTCDRIRRDIQIFVDTKVANGDLCIQL